jgi:hypothetical protein
METMILRVRAAASIIMDEVKVHMQSLENEVVVVMNDAKKKPRPRHNEAVVRCSTEHQAKCDREDEEKDEEEAFLRHEEEQFVVMDSSRLLPHHKTKEEEELVRVVASSRRSSRAEKRIAIIERKLDEIRNIVSNKHNKHSKMNNAEGIENLQAALTI